MSAIKWSDLPMRLPAKPFLSIMYSRLNRKHITGLSIEQYRLRYEHMEEGRRAQRRRIEELLRRRSN